MFGSRQLTTLHATVRHSFQPPRHCHASLHRRNVRCALRALPASHVCRDAWASLDCSIARVKASSHATAVLNMAFCQTIYTAILRVAWTSCKAILRVAWTCIVCTNAQYNNAYDCRLFGNRSLKYLVLHDRTA